MITNTVSMTEPFLQPELKLFMMLAEVVFTLPIVLIVQMLVQQAALLVQEASQVNHLSWLLVKTLMRTAELLQLRLQLLLISETLSQLA